MRDEIFWGNLIGLLKKGRWNLSFEESSALIAVVMEAEKRSKPPKVEPIVEPVKVDAAPKKPKKVKTENGNN